MVDYIDKLAWILIRDRKFLTTRSEGKDTWYIPGGKRDDGESDRDALVREIEEELTVRLQLDTIKPYGVFEAQAHGKDDGVIVRMTCYMAKFDGNLQPDNEIEEYAFMGYDGKDVSSPVDQLIIQDMRDRDLID